MSHTLIKGDNLEELKKLNLDLNDVTVLDSLSLNKKSSRIGLIKSIFFTAIAIFIFFIPLTIKGTTDVPFGFIYNFFIKALGNFGLWLITLVIVFTGILSVYGKFFAKKNTMLNNYFGEDSVFHPFLYSLGGFFTLVYTLDATIPGFTGPEWIVGSSTGGTVVPAIVMGVAWIIPVGCFFMPFLLNYGVIDFVGSLMEPLMRPVFKVPGRAAVNAIASFVSSSSVGVLITNKLYNTGVYTEKEAVLVATGFSAVSVGFAYMVIKTAGLADHFLKVYFIALFITLLISAIMSRIPPLCKKKDIYYNGKIQTKDDIKAQRNRGKGIIKTGFDRAIKKSYTANNIFREIKSSLIDGYAVFPKVLTLLASMGILGLIVAEYTPFFNWIGALFIPLLKLFQVPNAVEIAPSLPVGIAEMFLPVLLIADKVELLDIGARYVVTTISIVQIIFFSETIVVMMAAKLPVKLSELIICFFERTILAIPITSLFMHILF